MPLARPLALLRYWGLAALVMCGLAISPASASRSPVGIIAAIALLEEAMPFSRRSVDHALGILLEPVGPEVAGRIDYLAEGPAMTDGVSILKVDLRMLRSGRSAFLVLELGGMCLTPDVLAKALGTPAIELHLHPLPDQAPIRWFDRSWGRIAVDFRDASPDDCATVIAFHMKRP